MRESQVRFVRQQGFDTPDVTHELYAALMFQPRIIGVLFVPGILLQSPWLFLALSAVLWWSTVVPSHNAFDAIYNHLVAYPRGLPPLGSAPAPRRFAQGLSAAHLLAIGAALAMGAARTAWVLEGVFAVAVMSVVFRDLCAGAALYYILRRLSRRRHSRLAPSVSPDGLARRP
jgi:hypothetical protein